LPSENLLENFLKQWPQALEMQISNPTISLGSNISKIECVGNFRHSRIDVIIEGASKEISEFKVVASIISGATKELEAIGTINAFENQILIKVLLSPEIFYQSILLLKDRSCPSFLHLECIGLKQQEPNSIWNPNEGQLCIKEASIVFLQQ
jgi:hypothetical protein